MTEASSAAESIYRFFAAFEGFDEAHPLGFEAEVMMPRPGPAAAADYPLPADYPIPGDSSKNPR